MNKHKGKFLGLWIEDELYDYLKQQSVVSGISMKEVVTTMIRNVVTTPVVTTKIEQVVTPVVTTKIVLPPPGFSKKPQEEVVIPTIVKKPLSVEEARLKVAMMCR